MRTKERQPDDQAEQEQSPAHNSRCCSPALLRATLTLYKVLDAFTL